MHDYTVQHEQFKRMTSAFPCLRRQAFSERPAAVAKPAQRKEIAESKPMVAEASVYQGHSLSDQDTNLWLYSYEKATRSAFDAIYAALRDIATIQHEHDFVSRAKAISKERLGFELPDEVLERAWVEALDIRALYSFCVFNTFVRASEQQIHLDAQDEASVIAARGFFASCGLHEVDVSLASDGRLKGVERFVLRLPRHALRHTKAYSAGLFDVETDLKRWQRIELKKRIQASSMIGRASHSRYLKVAVYNRSSLRPAESGCGIYRGKELAGVEAVLNRLNSLRSALQDLFPEQDLAILLLGVDTDTDALRIHLPDAEGDLNAHRYIDMQHVYNATLALSAHEASRVLQQYIDQVAGMDGWARGQGQPDAGMRRFVTQLMYSNISQIDFVRRFHAGHYHDFAHAERLMLIGENIESFQLRNIVYYTHQYTFEEGRDDIEQGMSIFRATHLNHGLPIPVMIHYRYNAHVADSRAQAITRCVRVRNAMLNHYAALFASGKLQCFMTVRAKEPVALLEWVDGQDNFINEFKATSGFAL